MSNFCICRVQQHLKTTQKVVDEDQIEGEELKRLAAQYELVSLSHDTVCNYYYLNQW